MKSDTARSVTAKKDTTDPATNRRATGVPGGLFERIAIRNHSTRTLIRETPPGRKAQAIATHRLVPKAMMRQNGARAGGAAAADESARPRSAGKVDRSLHSKIALRVAMKMLLAAKVPDGKVKLLAAKVKHLDGKTDRASEAIANEDQGAISDVRRPQPAKIESSRMKNHTRMTLTPTSWIWARMTSKQATWRSTRTQTAQTRQAAGCRTVIAAFRRGTRRSASLWTSIFKRGQTDGERHQILGHLAAGLAAAVAERVPRTRR
jgi:hypothetical protein